MANPYTSVRILTNDLVGKRLAATSNSLWAIRDTVNNYAFLALNDAIGQYPIPVQLTYWSAMFHTTGQFAGLPPTAKAIVNVRDYSTNSPVHHYRIYATPNTTLLSIPDYTGQAVVTYRSKVTWFPCDTTLAYDSQVRGGNPAGWTLATVSVQNWTGGLTFVPLYPASSEIASFPNAGYVEITHPSVPGYEVAEYWNFQVNAYHSTTSADAFYVQSRRVAGGYPTELGWTPSSDLYPIMNYAKLSYAVVAPKGYFRVVNLAAEAAMYQYWMSDRANYDAFTAIASMQYMTPKDILQLINTYEARALMMYRNIQPENPPNPADTSKLRTRLPK